MNQGLTATSTQSPNPRRALPGGWQAPFLLALPLSASRERIKTTYRRIKPHHVTRPTNRRKAAPGLFPAGPWGCIRTRPSSEARRRGGASAAAGWVASPFGPSPGRRPGAAQDGAGAAHGPQTRRRIAGRARVIAARLMRFGRCAGGARAPRARAAGRRPGCAVGALPRRRQDPAAAAAGQPGGSSPGWPAPGGSDAARTQTGTQTQTEQANGTPARAPAWVAHRFPTGTGTPGYAGKPVEPKPGNPGLQLTHDSAAPAEGHQVGGSGFANGIGSWQAAAASREGAGFRPASTERQVPEALGAQRPG